MNYQQVFDVINLGVVILNRQYKVLEWNRWMTLHSGIRSEEIVNTCLFNFYPQLNYSSFLRDCKTVLTFGNVVFLSQKLHKYLFPFKVTGVHTASFEYMLRAGTPFYERNWIVELVRFVQEHNLPLDFLSWHYYDAQPEHYTWSVQKHQRWIADLDPEPQLLLTEWNWSGSVPHSEFDTGETVAYIAAVITRLSDSPLKQAFFFEPMDSSTTWEGRAMIGGRVSKASQNVILTTNVIKEALGLPMSPEEQRAEEAFLKGEDGAGQLEFEEKTQPRN